MTFTLETYSPNIMQSNTNLLRRALQGNALFSATTGLGLLLAGGALAPLLGVPALVLRLIGLSLVPFALGLWRNAARDQVHRGEVWIAVGLDSTWVLGSAALLTFELWPLTTAGFWTVLAVADTVLVFGFLQFLGLQRGSEQESTTGLETN